MNSIRNRVYAGEIAGGADTVEYVIVAIVAVIIGAALIAFGNQMRRRDDQDWQLHLLLVRVCPQRRQ